MLNHGQPITAKDITSITSDWTPDTFVSLCNAIVWQIAKGRGVSLPSFTERLFAKDGGIDAQSIELDQDAGYSSHLLGTGWTVFQYKLRDISAQNRAKLVSDLKSELKKNTGSDSRKVKKEYIGAIRDVYDRNQRRPDRYVLFTNLDLTDDQKKDISSTLLLGYDQPEKVLVVVNGAAELAAYLNSLPHLRSAYFVSSSFCIWKYAYASHLEENITRGTVPFIGQESNLTALKTFINDPGMKVAIVTGPVDSGKSRLALEATQMHQTNTVVAFHTAYLSPGDLLKVVSPDFETIVIIEDPESNEVERFVRQALSIAGIKLIITLPTAENTPTPNFGQDKRIHIIPMSPLNDQQAWALLKAVRPDLSVAQDFSMESWIISQSSGNPGILLAAVASATDLRKSTAGFIEEVANAFQRKIQKELGDRSLECLRILSLLSRVDISGPSYGEIKRLLSLFHQNIQLNELLSEISRLIRAGVVRRRGKYAEVVPSLLANHLAMSLLRGRSVELTALFAGLHQKPRVRLIERLREMRGEEVTFFWDELFAPDGLFATFQNALSNIELLHSITSAVPQRIAQLLKNSLSLDACRSMTWDIKCNLQNVLRDLLFRQHTSKTALQCFFFLFASEPLNNTSKISTDFFYDCFHPWQPQCPLSLEDRLDILQWAVSSAQSMEIQKIGQKAIIHALSAGWSFSLYESKGPEPLATQPQLTWIDIWDYWEALLDMLLYGAQSSQIELAEQAQAAIPDILSHYALFGHNIEKALARCRQVAHWCVTGQISLSISKLSGALVRVQRSFNPENGENDEAREKLQSIYQEISIILGCLETSDFSIRLKRWIGTWSADEHKEEVRALVTECICQPELLTNTLITWLISEEAKLGGMFFEQLGELDRTYHWLSYIEQLSRNTSGEGAFASYFQGISTWNHSFATQHLDKLVDERKVTAEASIRATAYLPADEAGVKRVERLLSDQRIDTNFGGFRLLTSMYWIRSLQSHEYLRLLQAVVGKELENVGIVINSLSQWLDMHTSFEEPIIEFAWQCVEKFSSNTLDDQYKCDRVISKLCEVDIEHGFDLYQKILMQLKSSTLWNPLVTYGENAFWTTLCYADRKRAITIPLSIVCNNVSLKSLITNSLLNVIDQENDTKILLEFAYEHIEQARIVCRCLTATKSGFWQIALDILRHYSDDKMIADLLFLAALRSDGATRVLSGVPRLDMQERLDDIHHIRSTSSRSSLSKIELKWLEQVEKQLRADMNMFEQYETGRESYHEEASEDNPLAPERLWAVQRLVSEKNFKELQKSISSDEMLLLLPHLQISEDERKSIKERLKRWE